MLAPKENDLANKNTLIQGGDGTAVPTGVIGETVTSSPFQIVGSGSSGETVGTLNVSAGRWLITVSTAMVNSSGTITAAGASIKVTSNSSDNPGSAYDNMSNTVGVTGVIIASNTIRGYSSGTFVVTKTDANPLYLRASYSVTGGGSIGLMTTATAIRIG